jgi:hypothetical protein
MGHQVEYLLKLAPPLARGWLTRFDGFWVELEVTGELPCGVFRLWDDLSLHADLARTACMLSVPGIKYSWLIAEHAPALAHIERFERLLAESLPGVLGLRVDELFRLEWEEAVGSPCEELPAPVESLRNWLPLSDADPRHFRFLPNGPDSTE